MSLVYFGLGLFLGTSIGFFVAAFFKAKETEYPDSCLESCPYKPYREEFCLRDCPYKEELIKKWTDIFLYMAKKQKEKRHIADLKNEEISHEKG
jgi:hypothetical protein